MCLFYTIMEWLGDRFTRSDRKQTKMFFPVEIPLNTYGFLFQLDHSYCDFYTKY